MAFELINDEALLNSLLSGTGTRGVKYREPIENAIAAVAESDNPDRELLAFSLSRDDFTKYGDDGNTVRIEAQAIKAGFGGNVKKFDGYKLRVCQVTDEVVSVVLQRKAS